ncbi:MAG: DUF4230 domain-containing protein [Ruminococcus sp.]|nr:DUF4230 domain-containing protein [Ruminococcus sp.]
MVKMIIGIVVVAVIAAAGFIFGIKSNSGSSENSAPEIISETTLEKIINVSNLSTFETVYNGIAQVQNEENPENIDYYVSYEAKVKAGIDFDDVEINVDNEQKIITVTMPEVKINDVNVDITTLDFIFENDNANNETVSQTAYNKCIEDVTEECQSTKDIYEIAGQNAKNIIEALITPFVQQLDNEYKLTIK